MYYYVYMLKTLNGFKNKTYVGYTINLKSRLVKHNTSKGAKATKGYKWKIIYKKRFNSKSKALSYEYYFKKDRKKRLSIIERHIDD
jgi:putative endonuclease